MTAPQLVRDDAPDGDDISPYARRLGNEIRRLGGQLADRVERENTDKAQATVALMHEVFGPYAEGRRDLDAVALILAGQAAVARGLPIERDWEQWRRTAGHEAGHAVIAIKVGIGVNLATIVPPPIGTSLGYVQLNEAAPTEAAYSDVARVRIENFALVDLAGPCGEDAFGEPVCPRETWAKHRADARRTLFPIKPFLGDGALTSYVAALEDRARAMVAANWSAIYAVRNALLDRNQLTGDEIQEIVARAEGGAV